MKLENLNFFRSWILPYWGNLMKFREPSRRCLSRNVTAVNGVILSLKTELKELHVFDSLFWLEQLFFKCIVLISASVKMVENEASVGALIYYVF